MSKAYNCSNFSNVLQQSGITLHNVCNHLNKSLTYMLRNSSKWESLMDLLVQQNNKLATSKEMEL